MSLHRKLHIQSYDVRVTSTRTQPAYGKRWVWLAILCTVFKQDRELEKHCVATKPTNVTTSSLVPRPRAPLSTWLSGYYFGKPSTCTFTDTFTGKTWRMACSVYQGLPFPSPRRPGDEAIPLHAQVHVSIHAVCARERRSLSLSLSLS